jgi:glycosyltransferase involved in cell wall biosynthesis
MRAIHFDADLLGVAARALPEFRFQLYGPAHAPVQRALASLRNVTLHGPIPHHRVPAVLAAAHAVILPYRMSEFTRAVYPAKTFESLAIGVPTVATPLPDLMTLAPHIRIADDAGAFIRAVQQAVADRDPSARRERRRVAGRHDEATLRERVLAVARSAATGRGVGTA